jgi:prepilin-type N-terminal cleavage/methylation domain-containing protein
MVKIQKGFTLIELAVSIAVICALVFVFAASPLVKQIILAFY